MSILFFLHADNMNELTIFLKENYLNIVFIVFIIVFVFGLLVVIQWKGIDLNAPKPDTHLVQEVTVETFEERSMADSAENLEQLKLLPTESFCESYLGKSSELEPACNGLTESNCADVACCVFTNGKCVAGDINGPTYKTDKNGQLITMDTYYYMGKKMP